MIKKYIFPILFSLFTVTALCSPLHAAESLLEASLVDQTKLLVFQISIILFAAWLGGMLFNRWKLPSVLGEIVAGIIIGPYLLGRISFPGFEHGLFPLHATFPISVELYSFAAIASIILLFIAGLETDIEAFLRFSVAGSVVGIFGVIFSFAAGNFAGVLLSDHIFGVHYGFLDPVPLILGVISMATSVSLSARILSGKRKMNSPEGVTIISSAVIDDVLGIITLAVVLGMARSGTVEWQQISFIALKAIGIWLAFTVLGLRYAHLLSKWLKKIKNRETITIISFALALLLAGIFEKSGLAMIIGAYVMGLSLSKTDLSFIIQERLAMLQKFFVPIFFCVMGMLINLDKIMSPNILFFGLVYAFFAISSKLIGCGIPALFLNFNWRGALRIGVGMVPRGEVALIIAGVGLSSGLINDEVFSIVLIMTFVTLLITPPVLDKLLSSPKPVLRKEPPTQKELKTISFSMPNPETADLLLRKLIEAFEAEGFFIHSMGRGSRIYNIRKNRSFITLTYTPQEFTFDCFVQDVAFLHTVFYEVIADVEQYMKQLQSFTETEEIGRKIFETENGVEEDRSKSHKVLSPLAVETELKGATKKEILIELVNLLIESGQVKRSKKDEALRDLWEREATMSTGMQDNIALPHTKTLCVNQMTVAVGISQKGVDFSSLDNEPSKIFIMTLIPEKNPQPYLRTMSEVSRFLISEKNREEVLQCQTKAELFKLLDRHI